MKPYDWCDPRCPNPCACQRTIDENTQPPCADERCGHPQGWHFRNEGSCLECGCTKFVTTEKA